MTDYTFRLRLRRCSRTFIPLKESRLEWYPAKDSPSVALSSGSDEVSLDNADTFYFKSSGWHSESEASVAGSYYTSALMRTLARLRIGVDAGRRGPAAGGWTKAMLQEFREDKGIRIINDAWGLMVYETDPPPVFSSWSGDIARGPGDGQFQRIFEAALADVELLSDREMIALDLFNASFFQDLADSRLLMLMMSVEALLEPAPRSDAAVAHVETLIKMTKSSDLPSSEKASIAGTLAYLRRESIRRTALKLVDTLGDRRYSEKLPREFFDYCYDLRSSLVHGACPLPTQAAVGLAAANLEVMVSDLLAGRLRDVDLDAEASG